MDESKTDETDSPLSKDFDGLTLDKSLFEDQDKLHIFSHHPLLRTTEDSVTKRNLDMTMDRVVCIKNMDTLVDLLNENAAESRSNEASRPTQYMVTNSGCTGSGKTVSMLSLASRFIHSRRVAMGNEEIVVGMYLTFNTSTPVDTTCETFLEAIGRRLISTLLACTFNVDIMVRDYGCHEPIRLFHSFFPESSRVRICLIIDELKLGIDAKDKKDKRQYIGELSTCIRVFGRQFNYRFHPIVSAYNLDIFDDIKVGSSDYTIQPMELLHLTLDDIVDWEVRNQNGMVKMKPDDSDPINTNTVVNVCDLIKNHLLKELITCNGRPKAVAILCRSILNYVQNEYIQSPSTEAYRGYVTNLATELSTVSSLVPLVECVLSGKVGFQSPLDAFCNDKRCERISLAVLMPVFTKMVNSRESMKEVRDGGSEMFMAALDHLEKIVSLNISNETWRKATFTKKFEQHITRFLLARIAFCAEKQDGCVTLSDVHSFLPKCKVDANFVKSEKHVSLFPVKVLPHNTPNKVADFFDIAKEPGWFLCSNQDNKAIEGAFVMNCVNEEAESKDDGVRPMLLTIQMKFQNKSVSTSSYRQKVGQAFGSDLSNDEREKLHKAFPGGIHHLYITVKKLEDGHKAASTGPHVDTDIDFFHFMSLEELKDQFFTLLLPAYTISTLFDHDGPS